MPTIRFFIFILMLYALPYAPSWARGTGHGGTQRMYEEGIAELKRNNYNGSLKKLLGFISAEETAKTPDSVRLADAYYYFG